MALVNFRENDPKLEVHYFNMGNAYRYLDKFDESLMFYEKGLGIIQFNYRDDHPKLAPYYLNIGHVYKSKSKFNKALKYYKRSCDLNLNSLGVYNNNTLYSYHSLGTCYFQLRIYV